MQNKNGQVEVVFYAARESYGAEASEQSPELNPEQVEALQSAIQGIAKGFKPPDSSPADEAYRLEEVEVSLGFSIEVSGGSLIKLIFDGKASGQITATMKWRLQ